VPVGDCVYLLARGKAPRKGKKIKTLPQTVKGLAAGYRKWSVLHRGMSGRSAARVERIVPPPRTGSPFPGGRGGRPPRAGPARRFSRTRGRPVIGGGQGGQDGDFHPVPRQRFPRVLARRVRGQHAVLAPGPPGRPGRKMTHPDTPAELVG